MISIEQISIYVDDDCGSVEFYQGSEDKINDFIITMQSRFEYQRYK